VTGFANNEGNWIMQYLVILHLRPEVNKDALTPLYKPEAAKAWEMVASGVLRSIHLIKGPAGAVLLFEAADQSQVQALVAQLPLVEAGAVTVEILPLVPFTGWALLFASPPA
jgi:muconolactone delta-isomerase